MSLESRLKSAVNALEKPFKGIIPENLMPEHSKWEPDQSSEDESSEGGDTPTPEPSDTPQDPQPEFEDFYLRNSSVGNTNSIGIYTVMDGASFQVLDNKGNDLYSDYEHEAVIWTVNENTVVGADLTVIVSVSGYADVSVTKQLMAY